MSVCGVWVLTVQEHQALWNVGADEISAAVALLDQEVAVEDDEAHQAGQD